MIIKKMISQHRRDFTALYECEHCKDTEEKGGYDDTNFHNNVIPKMACSSCGKIADESYKPRGTRYEDGFVV